MSDWDGFVKDLLTFADSGLPIAGKAADVITALQARIKALERELKDSEDSLTLAYMCGYSDGKRLVEKQAALLPKEGG